MNTYPCQLVIEPETARKLQAHCINISSTSMTVEDFNDSIEAIVIGLQASDNLADHIEASRLADMQIWTTAQLKKLGIFPIVNPTTFSPLNIF
jgi:hypothetical protein